MKAHIFTAFVWSAVEEGYSYAVHAIAAHTSAEAEEILKADNMIQPGDAAFIYTDEHVNSQYRSNILAYYTTWSHDKSVPIREYVAWVDQMTKPSFDEDQTEAHPAVYRMI